MVELRQSKGVNLKQRLNRLLISSVDFDEACTYLETYDEVTDQQARQALLVAAIVAYCRPFLQSNGGPNANATSTIKRDILDVLDKQENLLHDAVCVLRNKVIAHSDSMYRPVKIDFQDGVNFSYSAATTQTHLNSFDHANLKKIALKMYKQSRILASDLRREILELNSVE